jgi:hypothetical protein
MIEVLVSPLDVSRHTSQIYSGLHDLEHQGQIELTVAWNQKIRVANRRNSLWLKLRCAGRRVECYFDLRDGSKIDPLAIGSCDVYFKRGYAGSAVQDLEPRHRGKVLPYGLNFGCRSRTERKIAWRMLCHLAHNGKSLTAGPERRRMFSSYRQLLFGRLNNARFFCGPPLVEMFEVPPDTPVKPTILFLSRAWQSPKDRQGMNCCPVSRNLNDRRAETIRILKRAFGNRFIGGLAPDDFARKHYPDCLAQVSTRQIDYLRLLRQSLIAVTTTGLHNSMGFKLAEYLAGSKCIVTEPLNYTLPTPLMEGVNYLTHTGPEECLEACRSLLHSPDRTMHMRKSNFDYYSSEVKPASLVAKHLQSALGAAPVVAVG